MKIPKTFYIKGTKWKTRFRKRLVLDGDVCAGITDVERKTVTIQSGMHNDKTTWVFWHEYFHAVISETSVAGNTGGISDLAEEIICDAFATSMIADKEVRFRRARKSK